MSGNEGFAARQREEPDRYLFATRLNSFRQGQPDVANAIRVVANISALSALELNYPQHFYEIRERDLADLLVETGLQITALNLRFDAEQFIGGAFTHPEAATRDQAVRMAQEAVDVAQRFGARHVVLWMENDGFDYPFQIDYADAWAHEIEGFRRVAEYDPGVRVSVEYKAADPRRFALIRSMGEALLAGRDVDRSNFGVTLDFCHSLMVGEQPAAAAALALKEQRLFGIHLNDGYGRADDGLMVGSVHLWQTLELLAVLVDGGYAGTLYFDTFPQRENAAGECAANIGTIKRYLSALETVDRRQLAEARVAQDALAVRNALDRLFGHWDDAP